MKKLVIVLVIGCGLASAQVGGAGPSVSGLPSTKPAANDLIQYVSNNGNDANDGLSWTSAKLTIAAACTALGSNSACTTAHAGIVYVAPGFTGSQAFPSNNTHAGPLLYYLGGVNNSPIALAGAEFDILANVRIWNSYGALELIPANASTLSGTAAVPSAIQYFLSVCWNGSSNIEQDIQMQANTPAGTSQDTTLAFAPFGGCSGTQFIVDFSSLSFIKTTALQMVPSTVAALPTCNAARQDQLRAVSDATAPTYNGTMTGGGAVRVPVYCDGSAWKSH